MYHLPFQLREKIYHYQNIPVIVIKGRAPRTPPLPDTLNTQHRHAYREQIYRSSWAGAPALSVAKKRGNP